MSVIGRIATATMELNLSQTYSPALASLSVVPTSAPKTTENHVVRIFDGIVRTGAARFSDGTVRLLGSDLSLERGINDVDVIGVEAPLRSGAGATSLTALVDGAGQMHLLVDDQTQLAQKLAAATKAIHDNYSLELPSAPEGRFRSVSMVGTAPGNVRIFGLTDSALFACDIDLAKLGPDSDVEWKPRSSTAGARFIRAVDANTYLVAKEDGQVDFYNLTGRARTERIPGAWLSSLSAYGVPDESGDTDIRFAALSYSTGKEPRPVIHLWEDEMLSELPLEFPDGEAPVAVAFSGTKLTSPQMWAAYRKKDIYPTGHLSEFEPASQEVRRLLLMSRKGNNYVFRGVQGWAKGELKLSSFPWFYVGPGYSELQKQLAQAGFDVESLRENLNFEIDVGERAEKLATRLRDGFGFERFDAKQPQNYRGSPESLAAAWKVRLVALRDLRLSRARVASSIAEEGIVPRRDQMLVYELMNLEERLRSEQAAGIDEEYVPLTDEEWIADFRERLTDQASSLIQLNSEVLEPIQAYYDSDLRPRPWSDVNSQDYELLPEEVKPLYLISAQYLHKPFKYVVEDYIRFAKGRPERPYWEVLADYLDTVDPLRAVVDADSLLQFLTASRP